MAFDTYNEDLRYEMMASILPDPQFENTPDAATVIDDLREIIKLCYIYTAPQPPKEFSASDLGEAIVTYLFGQWARNATDLEQAAREHWGYTEQVADATSVPDGPPEPDAPVVAAPNWGSDGH